MQAGAAGAVAADALIGRQELILERRIAVPCPHVVVGLGRHQPRELALRQTIAQPESLRERAIVRRIVAAGGCVFAARVLDAALQALPGRIEKEVLAQEDQRLARFALNVLQRSEGLIILRGCVAIRAVLAKAHPRVGGRLWRRPIHGPTGYFHGAPTVPAPEPAIVGAF